MRRSDLYQLSLICTGAIAAAFFGVFLYRELFPEYKIYQNDYIALEKFRSTYTGEPPPAFQEGVKQIILVAKDNGPPTIDRCTSCHVALDVPYFSPTKIARDANGQVISDSAGVPKQEPNPDYIWDKLDQKIAELTDVQVNQQLQEQGDTAKLAYRKQQAEQLTALKTAKVGDQDYDVRKVLVMHPLIGKETRPFEFHPVNEYGCTSCHGGNGRGLTTEKAHGPIYDGQYEEEYEGPRKVFLESDPVNDPKFAHAYNGKPGPDLIFQTTPLMVGSLIEAKCMQCHQPNSPEMEQSHYSTSYLMGEQLFFSQACYACHRIAGFTRGGVGPELTNEGNTAYFWFVKKKLMWPQGDTPTSTMPNEKLDHEELEDLMTFVMAQRGENNTQSETEYKAKLQDWEKGAKLPWEQPLNPAQIHDVRYAMTIFATEGCAGCHRLKGFESDIGFAIEKEKPDFDSLYHEREWFSSLFPEEIPGSQIVNVINAHAEEIDRRIVNNVRSGSILEEIEKNHPGTVESFYANFKYANRAKNNPQWKERVHKILMMYVQEYGLGRLIGPRPNWSGIFRTDQWLMEHFHNPNSHSPQSIMPIFPFDDTKFLALTYMLDTLAIKNRDAVREIWKHRGFSPELAVKIHCSQCHGDYLEGNGPVAEWIYPIPKNLRNAEFLRNLTKERVIDSITHGVRGTPMPPWGEVAKDKPNDGIPELTRDEIADIVNWLFSSIPGGEVIKGSQDVPKWHYSPHDVLKELEEEGGKLESKPANQQAALFPSIDIRGYYASLEIPVEQVQEVFEVSPNPIPGTDEHGYYIKDKYYTAENIQQGKEFFELNCAVCHGAEADGTGARAEFMHEAKPRMLTNLDWLNMHDDLYLLRSIKYGMPGTAMTPWGDLTTSLQRLQLVMFIRSLTREQEQREQLSSTLYQAFDTAQVTVAKARVEAYTASEPTRNEYSAIHQQRLAILDKVQVGAAKAEEAAALYQKELQLELRVKQYDAIDKMFTHLIGLLQQESNYYKDAGSFLVGKEEEGSAFKTYLKLISLNNDRYSIKDSKLQFNPADDKEIESLGKKLIQEVSEKIAELERRKVIAEGKLPSEQRNEEISRLAADIATYTKLKSALVTDVEGAARVRIEQLKITKEIQDSSKDKGTSETM